MQSNNSSMRPALYSLPPIPLPKHAPIADLLYFAQNSGHHMRNVLVRGPAAAPPILYRLLQDVVTDGGAHSLKLVIIPTIMLVFIGAVACKFYYSSGGMQQYYDYENNSETGFANRVEMLVALAAVTLVPQLVCSGLEKLLVCQQQQQQQQQQNNDSSFLISHFLFFFSSSIGALQVMMATLRVAKVSQVLRMTFIVVLNMALHAKGAEWVGEDMVLVCMPELVAALLWFIGHFDHGGGYTKCIIGKVISLNSGVIVLSAVVILVSSMFATDRSIVVPTMSFRVFVSCTLAGMLSYFSMWVISGTGGDDDSAKVPIQLLKFSAFVCFGMSAVLVILHPLRLLEVTSFIDDVKAGSFHPHLLCFLLNAGGMLLIIAFRNHPSTGHQR